ncbi:PilZ domain-containing protein [Rheinheimera sp.]|uniref:PilZ domain-containing protein n=1 Tax=Rheinheimera sp. TaxID=1869214 RepID=UPI002616CBEE|nr:PilZ domain-containing protein [Rheinheimera sp.]MCA1929726.1 PilZ domain-containing protein [Rheinheimera sp.]
MQQPGNTNLAAELADEFADYFQIEHQTTVNLVPFLDPLPDQDGFLRLIPDAFKMTSELSQLNNSSIRTFNAIKDLSSDLALYLQQQARKLDALTHYVLRSQDDPKQRFHTFSYGGSGVQVWMEQQVEAGQLYEVKLFLDNNDGALFCLGQVLEVIEQQSSEAEPKPNYLVKILFRRIRDEDRDMVVRASLHEQSRQLKRKAEQRQLQAQQSQQ